MKPKISIIVPVYKVEQYLEECVNSILAQTYTNLEIILVDDGSPDQCGKMCDNYAQKDSRIMVIHQKNQGMSVARNTGIDAATGGYIGCVDSDDVIHPRMYEFLVKALEAEQADIAICHELAFNEKYEFEQYSGMHIEQVENQKQLYSHFLDAWTGPVNFVWNKLYKKELFDGVRFTPGIKMEDMYIQPDLFSHVSKAVWIQERLYGYRQRQGSIMNAGKGDVYIFWADALMHQREKIQQLNDTELNAQIDIYCYRTLARIQYSAQANGHKQIAKKLRSQYITMIFHQMSLKNTSLRDKIVIYMSLYTWPLYYVMLRIGKSKG